jgi:hypothetical protein
MASYRLRAEDVTYIRKAATDYNERPVGYRANLPIETIPAAYISKWYVLTNPVGPALSREGRETINVMVSRTEDEAKVVTMRSGFEIPSTEVQSAQRAGVPLAADQVTRQLANMNNKIAQMCYIGLDQPFVINGMIEDGTDAAQAELWGTAGEAVKHMDTYWSHMQTYNHGDGPFGLMCSTSLSGDLKLESNFNTSIYFETGVATASMDTSPDANPIYNHDWDTNDGTTIFFCKDVAKLALQETGPPAVYLNPELNRKTNCYEGFLIWQGTWRTTVNTAIAYNDNVNLYHSGTKVVI